MRLAARKQKIVIPGFRFSGVACGIKGGNAPDLALLLSQAPAVAAAAFTLNRAAAPPVLIGRKIVRRGRLQALVVNSGNANAGTGRAGLAAAERTRRQAAETLGIPPALVLPASTGKIGVPLPDLGPAIREAAEKLSPGGFWQAASAILTTDAFPKVGCRPFRAGNRRATLAVMAKGAGMIAPRMATLLVFFFTDAALTARAAREVVREAVVPVLNSITVDGDTSTNDTAVLMANGLAGNRPIEAGTRDLGPLRGAARELAEEVAIKVASDGEGATKLVEILVRGAAGSGEAHKAARAVAESVLVKTAIFGGDPNWGRVLAAVGRAGVSFDVEKLSISLGGVSLWRRGEPAGRAAERRARMVMKAKRILVEIDLGRGRRGGSGRARLLTCDLSLDYVRFNSAYST